MSALGQKQTSEYARPMSALPPKADIDLVDGDVRYVPKADITRRNKNIAYSISASARVSTDCGMVIPSALAVLRLITSSYFVGACTGKSLGLSPFRMRSTYRAAPRYCSSISGP